MLGICTYIIITVGKTAVSEPRPSLENSARFDLVFTSLDFAKIFILFIYFLQSKFVDLASNTQLEGPDLCIYVPQ
jgi:hypothetical protein